MTLHTATVTAIDLDPLALTLSFTEPERDSVATITSSVAGPDGPIEVHLAVLAASHQITAGPRVAPLLVETVACDADGTLLLSPDQADHPWCHVEGHLHHLDRHEARQFVTAAEQAPETELVVAFPGPRGAITWLRIEGLGWRSFHGYPQTNGDLTVVETVTRLHPGAFE